MHFESRADTIYNARPKHVSFSSLSKVDKFHIKISLSPFLFPSRLYPCHNSANVSGLYTSAVRNDSLCSEDNFQERTWTTQGRLEVTDPTPYPIIGEYTGVIPDTDGLCAKLYSDCNNPEIMFYTIFNCFNRSEIFEGKIACNMISDEFLQGRKVFVVLQNPSVLVRFRLSMLTILIIVSFVNSY